MTINICAIRCLVTKLWLAILFSVYSYLVEKLPLKMHWHHYWFNLKLYMYVWIFQNSELSYLFLEILFKSTLSAIHSTLTSTKKNNWRKGKALSEPKNFTEPHCWKREYWTTFYLSSQIIIIVVLGFGFGGTMSTYFPPLTFCCFSYFAILIFWLSRFLKAYTQSLMAITISPPNPKRLTNWNHFINIQLPFNIVEISRIMQSCSWENHCDPKFGSQILVLIYF